MAELERRIHPRYTINADAILTYDQGKCNGQINEISVDGARFICAKAINPGTFISINLDMANPVTIRGAVVWALESSPSGLPSYQIGIQIHDISVGGESGQGLAERTDLLQDILTELKA